jgi:hypothetical protein
MIARHQYFARRGYLALSLALDDADLDGFVEAMADVVDVHHQLFEKEEP